MPAATLADAAVAAYTNVSNRMIAGVLKANLNAFWAAVNPSFLEGTVNDHPLANWNALVAAVAAECPVDAAGANAVAQFPFMDQAAKYIYRMCWLGSFQLAQNLITAGQATALLNAFNAQFP